MPLSISVSRVQEALEGTGSMCDRGDLSGYCRRIFGDDPGLDGVANLPVGTVRQLLGHLPDAILAEAELHQRVADAALQILTDGARGGRSQIVDGEVASVSPWLDPEVRSGHRVEVHPTPGWHRHLC